MKDASLPISVIVPAYNAMDCLERCIDSLHNQTMPNIEIIIVDDGSTDQTGALAEKLALTDKRIRVLHRENGGSSAARNTGIEEARGEYLGFVDCDDYVEPMMFERLLRAATEEDLKMVQISRDERNEDGTRRPDVCIPPENAEIFDTRHIMRELLLHRGDCSFCTRITHRSLFEDPAMRFPEKELNEDFNLLVRMLPRLRNVAILPDQDYHVVYRMGSNSRTADKNEFPQVFTDIVTNADRVRKIVQRSYPELSGEAERFWLFQRLEYMLHIPIGMMTGDNDFYNKVKKDLRENRKEVRRNPYLTKKEKRNLMLLATAPKTVRILHRMMKGMKNNGE